MRKEKNEKSLNVRLSKRQYLLIDQLSRKSNMTKSAMLRRFMIDNITDDEPDYTPDEQLDDKLKIEELMNFIQANILREIVNLPLRQRESILSKLTELQSILSNRP